MSEVSEYVQDVKRGFRDKANHNKREALVCFVGVLVASSTAPLFITLGNGIVWGKLVPSVLSVIAAGLTSWLQLRKPQQLWSIYRGAQRFMEHHETMYNFSVGEYSGHKNPESLLVENIAKIAIETHREWTFVVPNPEILSLRNSKQNEK